MEQTINGKLLSDNKFQDVRRQTWSVANGTQLHVGQTTYGNSSKSVKDICLTRSEYIALRRAADRYFKI